MKIVPCFTVCKSLRLVWPPISFVPRYFVSRVSFRSIGRLTRRDRFNRDDAPEVYRVNFLIEPFSSVFT